MKPEYWIPIISFAAVMVLFLIGSVVKWLRDNTQFKEMSQRIQEAEDKAFNSLEKASHGRVSKSAERLEMLGDLSFSQEIPEAQTEVAQHHLLSVYTNQIKKYQEETRSRAVWSFSFAIIAMFAGIVFVFWGGIFILSEQSSEATIAGSVLSAIGGAVSAYITKTFLEVHKLSIQQLNRYFRQPVINEHIIMAQRLADGLEDTQARQTAYQDIIKSVLQLIGQEPSDA